jgi:septal ring factor EnvC (AmiA/AmiB activator)
MLTSILLFLNKVWNNRIIIVLGAFGVLIGAFYFYYVIASNRIDELTREKIELQAIVEQQKKAIEQIQRDYKHVIESKEELNKQIQDTQTEVQELREKLFRENQGKRPLEELATKKTTLIEKKINKATQDVLSCLELLTRGGDC